MFELSVAFKYLIPKRKQLSVALIASMSIGVIALVVWLLLIFLSVTEGIEKSWLDKLTSFNAPLRINPTSTYYSSYYYLIDSVSADSHYVTKTIGEKALAEKRDPYSPESDPEIPVHWSIDDKKDPVKETLSILESLKSTIPGLIYQDYEISGALLRLHLIRKDTLFPTNSDGIQSSLTQVSYLASFSDKSPYLQSLLLPPQIQDINHLFYLAHFKTENPCQDGPENLRPAQMESFQKTLKALFENVSITKLKSRQNQYKIPPSLLPEKSIFRAKGFFRGEQISHLILSEQGDGLIKRESGKLIFNPIATKSEYVLDIETPLFADQEITFEAKALPLEEIHHLKNIRFSVKTMLQGVPLSGDISWEGLEIADACIQREFSKPVFVPWAHFTPLQTILPKDPSKGTGILLAKSYQDTGILIGDRGFLSYHANTATSIQEQRLPIYIAGFYDPGIMAIGNKAILAPKEIVHAINTSNHSYILDRSLSNGIQVWFKDLDQVQKVKETLQKAFTETGIDQYWKVSDYREYDFAKDLLEQFQSDKYLFTLIGVIILVVACCNIISLLILLVNDKKREIGILQSMGASSMSIAVIFGISGIFMGIVSSLIGTVAAWFTMQHLDSIVTLLSFLQGHDLFNAAFYEKSLPSQLSSQALRFILIATPLISLAAGLVPAIKACRLHPSPILRSE